MSDQSLQDTPQAAQSTEQQPVADIDRRVHLDRCVAAPRRALDVATEVRDSAHRRIWNDRYGAAAPLAFLHSDAIRRRHAGPQARDDNDETQRERSVSHGRLRDAKRMNEYERP